MYGIILKTQSNALLLIDNADATRQAFDWSLNSANRLCKIYNENKDEMKFKDLDYIAVPISKEQYFNLVSDRKVLFTNNKGYEIKDFRQ